VVLVFFLSSLCIPSMSQDTISTPHHKSKKYVLTPIRATMYAAALPGLGQIYNRKYWKLPFVYGGFGALGYAVSYNSTYYRKYINAYEDFIDLIPATDSYLTIPTLQGIDPSTYDPVLYPDTYNSTRQSYIKTHLLNGVTYYRRYRDLSYIGIVAWYLVTIIDANVDASLFDYDISDDLKASIAPVTFTQFGVYPGLTVGLTKTF
jgi:hypothetical protein